VSQIKALLGMVIGFQGLRILLLTSYHSRLLGLAMVVAGYVILFRERESRFTKHRIWFLPVMGFLIVAGDLWYNLASTGGLSLHSLDTMTILFGGTLIIYNRAPEKYERELRFLAIFSGLFSLLLTLPLFLTEVFGSIPAGTYYTTYFLTKPLGALLKLVGVNAMVSGNWVMFQGTRDFINLGIGLSCSGAYSTAIFVSAFIAYVYVKYGRMTKRLSLLLAFGVVMAYFANLIRMLLIALVGYYYDTNTLIMTHMHLGWIIFMVWVSLFWYIGFRVLVKEEE